MFLGISISFNSGITWKDGEFGVLDILVGWGGDLDINRDLIVQFCA